MKKTRLALMFVFMLLCVGLAFSLTSCGDDDNEHIHTPNSAVRENEIAATCEAAGSYDEVVYCADCSEEISRTTKTIEKLSHTPSEWITDTEATCKAEGAKHKECTECHTVLENGTIDKLTTHTPAEAIRENEVDSTCSEFGSYDEVVKCSICGIELSRVEKEISKKNHSSSEWITDTEASCKVEGTKHKECTVCHTELETGKTDKLTTHTPAEAIRENEVDSSCSKLGSYDEVVKCSVCGIELSRDEKEIGKLPHTEVVDKAKAPTCTETGLTEGKHCSVCNEVITSQETVRANGHTDENSDYTCDICTADLCIEHEEEIIPAVPATCTETGLTAGKKCSICGDILVAQETVDALGHTEVVDNAKAPTCTETGLTEGKHCSVCSTVLVKQEIVDALGHTEVVDNAKAPTCTETGLTEGKHCSVCSTVLVKQETVDALGHTEVIDAAKAPTCTETGLTEGKHCSVCSTVLVAQKIIDALGHTEIVDAQVNPTCTASGLTKGSHCSVCEAIIIPQSVIDALGHSYKTVVTAPNCTEQGYTTYTCYCSYEYVGDYTSALGHTEVADEPVEPTCTETGLTKGAHCGICNEILVKQEIVDAVGHSYKSVVTAPTCTEEGYTTHTCHCGDTYKDSYVEPLGHTPVVDKAVAPDCTNIGLTEGAHCSVCEKVFVAQEVVPANGHTHSENVVENNVLPDCLNGGHYESVMYCTVCNIELSRTTVTVSALGHTEVVDKAVEPTCTETGLTEGKHCSVCSTVLVKQEIVDALGHTEVTDEAKAPTCTETGLTEGKHCSVCSTVLVEQEIVDALGHTEVVDNAKAPICTETGLTEGKHCSVCSAVLVAQEVVAARHNYTASITPPTSTNNGIAVCVCSVCGDSYSETLIPIDFTVTLDNRSKIGYTGAAGENLVIPEVFQDGDSWYRVTSIGSSAFDGCTSLKSIVIPDSVTSIGDYAFDGCEGLTSVTIPDSVISIGEGAFSDCTYLKEIYFNAITMNDLGQNNYVFYNAGMNGDGISLIIGKNVTKIPAYLFCPYYSSHSYSPKITSVEFEKESVCERIGNYAFRGCTSIEAVYIADIASWCNISFGDSLFGYLANPLYYAENIYLKGVLVTELVIPNGITSINSYAFENCTSLTSVTIHDSVTNIGSYAFENCTNLTSVTIGSSVTKIGSSAFRGCTSITNVTIPNSVTNIESRAFDSCTNLTSVTIPNSVTKIGSSAFEECYKLVEIINHSSLEIISGSSNNGYIGYYAKEIHTGESKIVNYDDYIFYTFEGVNYLLGYIGSDKVLVLPENCDGENYEIYQYAFYERNDIITVVIPDGVTTIGSYAFMICTNLTSVAIPTSITSIGSSAFEYCYKLVEVINHSSLEITSKSSNNGYVGYYAKEIHTEGSKIVKYNDYLFYTFDGTNYLLGYVGSDKVLVLPENYNGKKYEIYKYAFYNCDSLKSVTIGNGVTKIGSAAFCGCTNITSITIPSNVTSIGDIAFQGCTNLERVVICGNKALVIGNYAFDECNNLNYVTMDERSSKVWLSTSLPALTTNGKQLIIENVSPATLARYLVSDYSNYYWTI